MTNPRITWTVHPERIPDLADVSWRPVYGRFASYLIKELDRMWATAGVSRDHPWPPLAQSTLAEKARKGFLSDILVRSGQLRASFRALRLSDDGMVFGTDVPYAKYHDSDLPRKLGPDGEAILPQRKLLKKLERDEQRLEGFVGQHIDMLRDQGLVGGGA